MKLIKPDFARRIDIPGVAGPVKRPVNIDRSLTGFEMLRSLRIYCFDAGAIIDGHAEEDEVFVVVLTGSIEFVATGAPPAEEASTHILSAPNDAQRVHCAAYLPPNAAYRLTSQTDSIIAYARATPAGGHPPKFFQAGGLIIGGSPVTKVLEEHIYGQQLRLRLFHLSGVGFTPVSESEPEGEALVHLQFAAGGSASIGSVTIEPWDTVALSPGEHPAVHLPAGSSALMLVVSAN